MCVAFDEQWLKTQKLVLNKGHCQKSLTVHILIVVHVRVTPTRTCKQEMRVCYALIAY